MAIDLLNTSKSNDSINKESKEGKIKITYHKRLVNTHNTSYVVNIYDVHRIIPRVFASKVHVVYSEYNKENSIVLVNNT